MSPYHKGHASKDRSEDEADWVLPDTLKVGKNFTGDVFYTEGKNRRVVCRDATVTIKSIVWKQELNPKFPHPISLTYLLFGTPKAAFLAHQISAPPKPGKQEADFDHVVSIEIATASKVLSPVTAGTRLIMRGIENIEKHKLQPGQRVTLSLPSNEQETIEVVVNDELQLMQLPTQR